MPQNIRIWKVTDCESLCEVSKSRLDLEEKLENWLEGDISMIGDDLLIIGRQVETEYGGLLDFLCIDNDGDLVVVELKRDRTPRDVTAQVLDYASWIKDLSSDRITEIADDFLDDKGPLDAAFRERFKDDLPDSLNQSHRMLIVASDTDPSTERIIHYLSSAGIGINIITFEHFTNDDGSELMARVFLIEPGEASVRVSARSKRRRPLTYEELEAIAHQNGVDGLYNRLLHSLGKTFNLRGTTRSSYVFRGLFGERTKTIMSFIPGDSSCEDGLRFQVYSNRLAQYLNLDVATLPHILPSGSNDWAYAGAEKDDDPDNWIGYTGFFKTDAEIDTLLKALTSG